MLMLVAVLEAARRELEMQKQLPKNDPQRVVTDAQLKCDHRPDAVGESWMEFSKGPDLDPPLPGEPDQGMRMKLRLVMSCSRCFLMTTVETTVPVKIVKDWLEDEHKPEKKERHQKRGK